MDSSNSRSAPLTRGDRIFLLVVLPVFVFLLRAPTFLYNVIDGDESVYLIVARSILQGHLPYTAAWDNKPPGIFFLFALGSAVFGVNVASIRLLGCLSIISTSAALYLIVRRLTKAVVPAALAGALYAVMSLGFGGRASNAEIFLAVPVAWSAVLVLNAIAQASPPRRMFVKFLVIGLLLGLAVQIKTVAVFDALALLAISAGAIWTGWSVELAARELAAREPRARLALIVAAGAGMAVGIGAWFGVVVGVYAATGHLAEYVRANITVNRTYSQGPFVVAYLVQAIRDRVHEDLMPWLAFPAAAAVLLAKRPKPQARLRHSVMAALLWCGLIAVAVISTRKFFGHYFLQLLLPICVLWGLVARYLSDRFAHRPRLLYGTLLLAMALPGAQVFLKPLKADAKLAFRRYWKGDRYYQDTAGALAAYLAPRIQPGQRIYACEGDVIVYILAHAEVPTRYVFAGYLTHEYFARVASVDALSELAEIMNQPVEFVLVPSGYLTALPEPRYFWEVRNPAYFKQLGRYLGDSYEMEASIQGVDVYRRATKKTVFLQQP